MGKSHFVRLPGLDNDERLCYANCGINHGYLYRLVHHAIIYRHPGMCKSADMPDLGKAILLIGGPGNFSDLLIVMYPPECCFFPQRMNAHVQFKTNQKNQCIKIYYDHKNQDRSDRAVYLIIRSEFIHPKGKKKSKQDHQYGC